MNSQLLNDIHLKISMNIHKFLQTSIYNFSKKIEKIWWLPSSNHVKMSKDDILKVWCFYPVRPDFFLLSHLTITPIATCSTNCIRHQDYYCAIRVPKPSRCDYCSSLQQCDSGRLVYGQVYTAIPASGKETSVWEYNSTELTPDTHMRIGQCL